MAGEYSRELSVKVFAGQCRLIELGFRQGGIPGYGLRRQLIDRSGKRKEVLDKGEHKSFQTDRIVLVPGPENEVAVVREIFDMFVNDRISIAQITGKLNARGLLADNGQRWCWDNVHEILTNPKYVGDNVYNRSSQKLGRCQTRNSPEMWIRYENAFEAVVNRDLFVKASYILQRRRERLSDDQLLDALKTLLSRKGSLSGILIDEAEGMPSTEVYRSRFGGLARAYSLIGYTPERSLRYLEINRAIRELHQQECASMISSLVATGAALEQDASTGLLKINDEFTVSLLLARCRETSSGSHRWTIRLENSLNPDLTVAGRLMPGNEQILDYYIFPKIDTLFQTLCLSRENGVLLDVYRFDNLDFFLSMARRVRINEAA